MMKKKRLLALILVMTFSFSCLLPTFAAETNQTERFGKTSFEEDSDYTESTESQIAETESETEATKDTLEETADETSESVVESSDTKETINIVDTTDTIESELETEPESNEDLSLLEDDFGNTVEGYVQRMYIKVLGRNVDPVGFDFWVNALNTKTHTGADMAKFFFLSDEYVGQKNSNEQFIQALYSAIMNRNGDNTGIQFWLDALNDGMSNVYVISCFIDSNEFAKICTQFGIVKGNITLTEARDLNPVITRFVTRCYRLCMNRNGDVKGLNFWTDALINRGYSGSDIASSFLESQEFITKNVDDKTYINTLYSLLMDRSSDPSGQRYWGDLLSIGMSRRYILKCFVGADEFKSICQSSGILVGSLTSTESRDVNPELTRTVDRFYESTLLRKPSTEDLNNWCRTLLDRTTIGRTFLINFMTSEEYTARNTSNQEFIMDLYQAAFNRMPSTKDVSFWTSCLNSGTSRKELCNTIASTEEYISMCKNAGIALYFNGWNFIDNNWYYYSNQLPQTGWIRENGERYYLNPNNGGIRQTGWYYIGGLKYFFQEDGKLVQDVSHLMGPGTSYAIKINRYANCLTVYAYDGETGDYTIPVKAMLCSTGGSATPLGTFYAPQKHRWLLMINGTYCQWLLRVTGQILIHSITYSAPNNHALLPGGYNTLGVSKSLGCIRVVAGNAKWIYDNCPVGTRITIYDSTDPGPFDKPELVPIPWDQTYDPTDPTV